MQFNLAAEMIETNAKVRKKIEKKRRNTKMKKEISTKDFELMQKTLNNLYEKSTNFSKEYLIKAMRMSFANMCCFKLFDFELFRLWLIDDFLLITDSK